MPKIQKIQPSLNTITSQAPTQKVDRGGIMPDVIAALGKTGVEIGDSLRRASALHEKTKAQNFFDSRIMDIQSRAESDNDVSPAKLQSYHDEIDQALADSSNIITTPSERDFYKEEVSGKSEISRANIRNSFVKKSISLGAAELNIYNDNKLNEYVKATNPKDKERAILERDLKIKEAIEAHYIDPGDAVKMQDELNKKWSKAQVEHDISVDPSIAKEILEANQYPGISEDVRVDLLKSANATIKAVSAKTYDELNEKLFEKSLTLEEVSAAMPVIGGVKAKTLQRALITQQNQELTPLKKDNDSASQYVDLVDKLVDDQFDNYNLKEQLLSVFADGVLDEEEAKTMKTIKQKLKDLKFNRESGIFVNSIKQIKSWFGRNNPEDPAIMDSLRHIIGYGGGIDKNEEEMKTVTDSLIRTQQQRINPNAGRYELGAVIQSDRGSWEVIGFDDDGEPLVRKAK
jgi:hypothetical protein